jgi:hypothetical protein
MAYDITPMQTLLLLDLLARGGESLLRDIEKPRYDSKKERIPLKSLGLIDEQLVPQPKGRDLTSLSLTDAAYEHLLVAMNGAKLPKSPECNPVAARLLTRVSAFIDANGLSVSEVFHDPPYRFPQVNSPKPENQEGDQPPPPPPLPSPPDHAGIMRLLIAIPKSRHMPGGGLEMAVVRDALRELPRRDVDRILIDLQNQKRIVLYPSVEKATPEQAEAAVLVSGDPRHFLYIQ